MTVSVNNQFNNIMKNSDLRIGVIVPPDKHYKPVLYSEQEANRQFNEMNNDIYSRQNHFSFEETKQTPKVISWVGALTAIAAAGWIFLAKFKK